MNKGVSLGYDGSLAQGIPFSTERRNIMTCLIRAQVNNNIVVASDTWTTNPTNSHQIQKITCSPTNSIIIASAGENGILLDNGEKLYTRQLMNITCQLYNGWNIEECIKYLTVNAEIMLNLIRFQQPYIVMQFFVVCYDKSTQSIHSYDIQTLRQFGARAESIQLNNATKLHSFGRYAEEINDRYHNTNIINKDEVKAIVQHYIDKEKDLPNEEKTVGGHVQWAYMDSNGNIESNIEI